MPWSRYLSGLGWMYELFVVTARPIQLPSVLPKFLQHISDLHADPSVRSGLSALLDGVRSTDPRLTASLCFARLLDRRQTRAVEPVAEAEKDRQSFISCGHLFRGKFSKHAPDPPLVY